MNNSEELQFFLDEAKEKMQKSVDGLTSSMSQIRSGRASAALVESIRVDIYGQQMPLNQVSTISVPEARVITVNVWDKSVLQNVEKAIQKSGRNLNPQNDGSIIRINLPDMTEETRREMVKTAKQKVEDYKVSIRNIRREANEQIKKTGEKSSEDEVHFYQDKVQKLTDSFIVEIDKIFSIKEKDIMTV